MTRLQAIVLACVAVLALAFGFALGRGLGHAQVAAAVKAADRQEAIATTDHAQGVQHDQEASNRAPVLAADDAEVERLEKLADPAPDPAPAPALPGSEVVGPPPVVVVDAEHLLVAALKKDLADTKDQLATVSLARDAYRSEAYARAQECTQLRAALAAVPRELRWSAGGVYGTAQTLGGYVERDLGPFRVGLDIVRRQLAGGQYTLEAVGRAGIRF